MIPKPMRSMKTVRKMTRTEGLPIGKGREDETDGNAAGAEVLAVGWDQGQDDPESDEVDEDRQEDDQDGGSSHKQIVPNGTIHPGWLSNDIARVYGQNSASQVRR